MSATKISWTDLTCNCVAGCDPASPGCANCYAIKVARRMEAGLAGPQKGKPASARQLAVMQQYAGLTETKVYYEGTPRERRITKWTGKVGVNVEPLRDLLTIRARKRVFIASMGDIFHRDTPRDLQLAVLAVAACKPNLTFQLVTKRPEMMLEFFQELDAAAVAGAEGDAGYVAFTRERLSGGRAGTMMAACARLGIDLPRQGLIDPMQPYPLRNVQLITSTERQQELDERVPLLLRCPAAVHGISAEPLLGPLDLRAYLGPRPLGDPTPVLRWVITGGESGRNARTCDVGWIRDILRQCKVARAHGAPVRPFNKQLGADPIVTGQRAKEGVLSDLRDPAGADPSEWPEDLRVQQFPEEV